MIQFIKQEIDGFIEKANKDPLIIDKLLRKNQEVLNNDLIIPTTGIATWGLYYYCPDHSVALEFNINNKDEHVCPVDGKVFTGEPYDGAWWRQINQLNCLASYDLGLLWLLTKEETYLNKAKAIMLTYAKYYPSYEVHGGIPYNGPGKANAQTLCEATWISAIAKGYDLIKTEFTLGEQELIEKDLFTVCAEFLCEHRTDQLHNHEIIINGAIAMLGIVLNKEDLIEFALNEKYGLYYQLENGVLEDFFWFEGSPAYHYYALEALFRFEKFARHTKYSNLSHPNYIKMLKMPLKILQANLTFPLLNDMKVEQGDFISYSAVYEFAYHYYGEWEFAWVLNKAQAVGRRNTIESFFYGQEKLPTTKEIELKDYHDANGSGLTILRGDHERYLLFKHSPFGGEHDHYDRLGFSFSAYGENIIRDLGTTGYGAILHYDYFKNTGTNNTVMINEENQPPANPKVRRYEVEQDNILIDADVHWDGTFEELDSHTRVEWDEESYKDVYMRRIILWCENYHIEVFVVKSPKIQTIDWVTSIGGRLTNPEKFLVFGDSLSTKKPLKYLHNIKYIQEPGIVMTDWEFTKCNFRVHSYMAEDHTLYYGQGPNNPSIDNIDFLVNRVKGKEAVYINVYEAFTEEPFIKEVMIGHIDEDGIELTLNSNQKPIKHTIKYK